MGAISGKAGTCTINSVAVKISGWSFDGSQRISDATDSGTAANFTAHTIGRRSGRFRISGWVQTDDLPNAKLTLGTALSTVHLTIDGSAKYIIPSATCLSIRVNAPIGSGDTVSFEAECEVNGTYTELA